MPMLDIQRRHAEVFRIRLGDKDGNRPRKLTDSIRVTSPNRSVIDAFVEVFGGDAKPWEQQWEAYLPTTELPIMVLPGQSITQWWEMYRGSVCERRCDGETESLSGKACMCPLDITERMQAKNACRPMTRVNVVCPDVAVVGAGSLVTHGMVAAETLPQSIQVAEAALARGLMVPAVLRVVEHKGKTHYVVPQIEIVGISLNQLTTGEIPQALGGGGNRSLTSPPPAAVAAPAPKALTSAPPLRPPDSAEVMDTKPLPAGRPPLPNELGSSAQADRDLETARSYLYARALQVASDKKGLLAKDWEKAGLPTKDKFASLTAANVDDATALIHRWVALSALEAAGFKSEKERHKAVSDATGGETESTKNLTSEQLDDVLGFCEATVETQQAPFDEAS